MRKHPVADGRAVLRRRKMEVGGSPFCRLAELLICNPITDRELPSTSTSTSTSDRFSLVRKHHARRRSHAASRFLAQCGSSCSSPKTQNARPRGAEAPCARRTAHAASRVPTFLPALTCGARTPIPPSPHPPTPPSLQVRKPSLAQARGTTVPCTLLALPLCCGCWAGRLGR